MNVTLSKQLWAALKASRAQGETLEGQLRRLLALAGVSVEPSTARPRGRPSGSRGPHAGLYTCEVGGSVVLPWRGEVEPATGAYPQDQSAVFHAVSRCEARTGFVFDRYSKARRGLVVTRIM